MTPKQRIASRLAFLFIACAGIWLGIALSPQTTSASCSTCVGPFYGANATYVNKAISGTIWPQTTSNACAIADVIGLLNYDYLIHGLGFKYPNSSGQTALEHINQTTGASAWGHATPINMWGGITNIAPDFGNDPRSVAYDVRAREWSTIYHHNWIYRWQFGHTTAPSFEQQVREATTQVARGVANFNAPVIVFINGGLHSVLVTGVWSTNNPNSAFPANIQGLSFRDSEGNATTSRQEVSMNTWLNGRYASPFGVYSLWSIYYGDRATIGDKQNTNDPEPTVGPYAPMFAGQVHWYLGFSWVQRDFLTTVSPDWSVNAITGKVMTTW